MSKFVTNISSIRSKQATYKLVSISLSRNRFKQGSAATALQNGKRTASSVMDSLCRKKKLKLAKQHCYRQEGRGKSTAFTSKREKSGATFVKKVVIVCKSQT